MFLFFRRFKKKNNLMLDPVALFFLTHHWTGQTGNAIPLLIKVGVCVCVW